MISTLIVGIGLRGGKLWGKDGCAENGSFGEVSVVFEDVFS